MKVLMVLILGCLFNLQLARAQIDKVKIDKIIEESGISKPKLGLSVVRGSEKIFELNSSQKMIPASLSKILTAIGVIKTFGSGFRFKTALYGDTEIKNQTLAGKLYLKGGGDPSLVSENMWVLVNHFLRSEIKMIEGPIIIDNSIFDEQFIDSSREDSRVDRAYDSPISAAPFNWNVLNVYVRPGAQVGQSVRVIMDPDNTLFTVKNLATTSGGKGQDIQVNRIGKEIHVSGKMGISYDEKVFYKNIEDPVQWVGQGLIDFLNQRGVQIKNKTISKGIVPAGAKLLADVDGWSTDELVNGMLRFSNNFIAEMLTKNISVKMGARQGTVARGISEIQKILAEYGIAPADYTFINPSGLTRDNKMSAQQLTQVLEGAKNDFTVSATLINGLPFPSIEGSLSKRFNGLKDKRFIRAKTGLLTGVVGLAGYAGQKNGSAVSFAFMYNGNGREADVRALFDRLASECVQ